MSEASSEFDNRLWIVVDGVSGRCYLRGNCHTHLGRMAAWSDDLARSLCVSKSEIIEASDLAWAWVDGFLAGNAPDAGGLFGPEVFDADDSDRRWTIWNQAIAEFRETGTWSGKFPLRDV